MGEPNVNVLFGCVMNALRGAVTPETVFGVADRVWAWALSKTAEQPELPGFPAEAEKEPIPEEPAADTPKNERAGLITEKQHTRLWVIAKEAGFTSAGVHNYLKTHKLESTKDIPWRKYNGICEVLSDPGNANIWNDDIPT